MKRFIPYIIILAVCFSADETLYSQQLKIAVFDVDSMVHALPEYAIVDSLIELYQAEDTPEMDYQVFQSELKKLDSILINIGDRKNLEFIDSISKQRQEIILNIIYWQEIVEQKDNIRRRRLAEPLYQRVNTAFKKVTSEKKYDIIIKYKDVESGIDVDNLFIAVAKELKLSSLPANLLQIGKKKL